MQLTNATNNLIVINFKNLLELILWKIQLLISPYVLKNGAASNFTLDQIGFGRPWFCLLYHCWENLLRLVYWKILTISSLLKIIYKVVQYQLSIPKSLTGNHLLKILIMVLKIVFLFLLIRNAFGVNTSDDQIAGVSGTIPVINRGGTVLFLFLSLLGGFSIIGMLRSWRLYCLGLELSLH